MHEFDKHYWEQHWREGRSGDARSMGQNPPNPYLVREIADLAPGSALDAGCGSGAEAVWLARRGWQVTAADISAEALAVAAQRATASGVVEHLEWIEADLSAWDPGRQFDLVMTHYAHPAMPQLEFYDRIAEWVAPGGTVLIVGHLHSADSADSADHGHRPPAEASATAEAITSRLDARAWVVVTADEQVRSLPGHGHGGVLHDVVVRATRRR